MRSVATPDDTPVGQSVNRDTTHPWTGTPMSYSSDLSTTLPSDDFHPPGSLRVEDQPFALVPEWVIDTDISDAAFRVYSLLLRYGNTSGQRMPSRKLLAVRLHRSVDAVDRAVRELADTGLVRIEHRRDGRRNLTNRYHLTTTDPNGSRSGGGRRSAPTPSATPQVDRDAPVREGRGSAGSRTSAATPEPRGDRRSAGRVAAEVRPDPEKKTQEPPPPNPPPASGTRRRDGGRRTSSPAAASPTLTIWSNAAAAPGRHWTSRPGGGPGTPCTPPSSSPSPAAGHPPSSSRRC